MNLIRRIDEARTSIMGLNVDSGELRAAARQGARARRVRQAPRRAARPARARATRSSSGSGSPPTSRCAGSPRRTSWARCGTRPADGTQPTIECLPSGKVIVKTGTSPHGQGHETAWAQIVADGLGVTPDDIEVLHGDTPFDPARHGHVRVAVGRRSAAWPCTSRWRRSRRRRGRSPRTSSRSPRTTSNGATARAT